LADRRLGPKKTESKQLEIPKHNAIHIREGRSFMVSLTVNAVAREFDGDPTMPLLWFIRDELALSGTKYGCGTGLCGACTVHVNGEAVRSCLATVAEAGGKSVTTIEGLSADGNHPVQQAWRDVNVPQCGFCQAGQIMQASALIAAKADLSDQEILDGMQGNICRCGCYQRIVAAVRQASTGA
jgi:isoquinoline 1-oxidoreductase alpha subunit